MTRLEASPPRTLNISLIRKEVEAICGKRIAIWQKKLPFAPSRLKVESEIRWVQEVRCRVLGRLDVIEREQQIQNNMDRFWLGVLRKVI